MKKILCFFLILTFAKHTAEIPSPLFVIWNVGQGSWSTFVDFKKCLHFDMGGSEFNFSALLKEYCAKKTNILFLTHFDSDHINFAFRTQQHLPGICLMTPLISDLSERKLKWLAHLPKCQFKTPEVLQIYTSRFKKDNESHIYQILNKILITGDAPAFIEKMITRKISKNIFLLLAGHHGSRTSTTSSMLSQLKNLKLVVVSAKKKKYGHPHKEVLARLQKNKIPCISTEDFSHIHIVLK